MATWFENAWTFANDFFCGISSDICKGLVHPENCAICVGYAHAFLRLKGNCSNEEVRLSDFSHADVSNRADIAHHIAYIIEFCGGFSLHPTDYAIRLLETVL